jgi:ribulose-5-phosphate 4-epimerase/fuculose-1-phosphate aldolase
MTHGAVYEADPDARYVFHTHSKTIWSACHKLKLQFTPEDVEYGTAEMARSVKQLSRDNKWTLNRAFVMLGHEDGVFTFGATAESAGLAMVKILTQAMKKV